MENNRPYLQKLGTVFLISVASTILLNFVTKSQGLNSSKLLLILLQTLPLVLFFIYTGILTEKWKAAIAGACVFIAAILVQYFLFKKRIQRQISLYVFLYSGFFTCYPTSYSSYSRKSTKESCLR